MARVYFASGVEAPAISSNSGRASPLATPSANAASGEWPEADASRRGSVSCNVRFPPFFAERGRPPQPNAIRTRSAVDRATRQYVELADRNLLRGTAAYDVLSGFGWSLGSSDPGEAHYALSAPVEHIDAFISHNWSTPRSDKFLALALHWNWPAMALAVSMVEAVALVCSALGVLPGFEHMRMNFENGSSSVTNRSPWCQVFGVVAIIVGLLFGHTFAKFLAKSFGVGAKTVFLDRDCVCQTDPELKRQGIESLAAVLKKSNNLVVLYSDVYLHKLWTVYEVATFLVMYPTGKVTWLPVIIPKVVLSGMFCITLHRFVRLFLYSKLVQANMLVHDNMDTNIEDQLVQWGLTLPWIMALSFVLRKWARQQSRMKETLREFAIADAECLNEDDRQVIMRNVAVFAKQYGHADFGAADEAALAEFDKLIQKKLPRLLAMSLGPIGIPYRYSVLMCSMYLFRTLDAVSEFIRDYRELEVVPPDWVNMRLRTLCCKSLWCISMALFVGPLAVASLSWLSTQLQKSCGGLVGITIGVSVSVIYYAGAMGLYALMQQDSSWAPWVASPIIMCCIVCTIAVYDPCRRCRGGSDEHEGRRLRPLRRCQRMDVSASTTSSSSSEVSSDSDSDDAHVPGSLQ